MSSPTVLERGTINLDRVPRGERDRVSSMRAIDYVLERARTKYGRTLHELPQLNSYIDKFMLISAGTGTGKSVSIPPTLYINLKDTIHRNIVTTQPRIISAVRTVQEDIVKYFPLKIGEDVGFQTGPMSRLPRRGLIYMQINILLQQIKTYTDEEFMAKYSCVIIDEAHERSIDTDLLLLLLRALVMRQWRNPMCPLVICMSATLELGRFVEYFTERKPHASVEVIEILGKSFPIENHFLSSTAGNYMWKIVDTIKHIHSTYKTAGEDILVFMSGDQQIDVLMSILNKLNGSPEYTNKLFFLIKLTSKVFRRGSKEMIQIESPIEQLKINDQPVLRRIIISTNFAEISVTINSLKFVIDSGIKNAVEFDPSGFTTYINKPITGDSAMQRRGRVGRVSSGHWFPMYTEETYNAMIKNRMPDIHTVDISSMILAVCIAENKLHIDDLDMIDSPSDWSIQYAIEKLYTCGCITIKNGEIVPTIIGKYINKFKRISISTARMILAGYEYGANILDLITITALMINNVKNSTYKPRVILPENRQAFLIGDTFIDLIFLFEEFTNIAQGGPLKLQIWCEDNNIRFEDMLNAVEDRDQLIVDLATLIGFDPLYNPAGYESLSALFKKKAFDIAVEEVIKIKHCIYAGFKTNLAVRRDEKYESVCGGFDINVPQHLQDAPTFLIYGNVSMTNNNGKSKKVIDIYSVMDGFVDIDYTLV